MRLAYHLEGLDCPSCAAKIETAASKLENVKKATVDFSSGRILLETIETEQTNLKDALQEIVTTVEPGVIISGQKANLKRPNLFTGRNLIFAGGILGFFIALLMPKGTSKNILYIIAYLLAGFEVIAQAIRNVLRGQIFDENFLMSIATVGALAIGEFPEAASVMIFYRTGEFLQSMAVDRSRRSISALIDIKPEIAHGKTEDGAVDIPVENIAIGDHLLVYPGERIPVDGRILEGSSSLDTSALTGESVPRNVSEGEEILAGCINLSGLLTIEATKLVADSAVSRILDLVENATANKAPTEDFITTFAKFYTPVVVGTAALIATIPPIFVSTADFSDWFYRALVFLVISCPCALVVSIPLGFFGGIGSASKHGILVKGSNYLQALSEVDTVVFDKTGTLTSGNFSVQEIFAVERFTKGEVLEFAAHAEHASSHPIARSIIQSYGKEINQSEIDSVEELSGFGVKVSWRKREILVGSRRLMQKFNIDVSHTQKEANVYIAVDGSYAGAIILVDNIKTGAKQAINRLKTLGIKTVMLTGDSRDIAERVGLELGIDQIEAELLPHQKVEELDLIFESKNDKNKVAFVGDGINDAPALAKAHVGVAMGALGSEAAIETADVVLMNDDLKDIVNAISIAKRTNKIVWQNVALAFAVKLIVLLLGGFGLATLWEAVFADVGVTILAVINSLRIITAKKKKDNRIL